MLTLRFARRDVCWTVSVVVERLASPTLASAGGTCTSRPARAPRTRPASSAASATPISRALSDAAQARVELSSASLSSTSSTPATSARHSPRPAPPPPHVSMPGVAVNVPETSINLTAMSLPEKPQELPVDNAATQGFSFEDYDCVGFDLDNTICRYKVSNMVKLEYKALSTYLIEQCNYPSKYLSLPVEDGVEFMIKGLILDVKKGNVLRIAPDGKILHGSHGMKELNQDELIACYGSELKWAVTDLFIRDPLHTWNGPLSETMRTLSDYFDMPASLAFARAVDTLDELNNGPLKEYDIYPHIQQALQNMFQKEHFGIDKGGYFPDIKSDPDNYIHQCSEDLLNWFKELKKHNKMLFLITGSNVDFASHTATKSLGANWQELFDIVICFAKKPGFFTQKRAFKALDGFVETHEVAEDELQRGKIYTSGNWDGVYKFLKKTSGIPHPKVVYIGDHLIQDVYTPATHTDCDAVAVCEELEAEGVFGHEKAHHDDDFLLSSRWGSYFHHKDEENVWLDFLRKHAKLVVPSLEYVAKHPIHHRFPSLQ